MSHTKGPWEVSYIDSNGQAVVKAEHIEVATCWHHCVGSIEKEMRQNALLIAAAPCMLKALSDIVSNAEQSVFDDWYAKKCFGGDAETVQYDFLHSSDYADFCDTWKDALAVISKATQSPNGNDLFKKEMT